VVEGRIRDDRVLPGTRVLGGVIVPFLLVAFVALYGFPADTRHWFAANVATAAGLPGLMVCERDASSSPATSSALAGRQPRLQAPVVAQPRPSGASRRERPEQLADPAAWSSSRVTTRERVPWPSGSTLQRADRTDRAERP
jgi:hypothetical protein